MTPAKRALDICAALMLMVVLAPVVLLISVLILISDGRPVLYRSERMRSRDHAFEFLKFRTMKPADPEMNTGVTGADKTDRITRIGRILRRTRLDELPQFWNVLRGDMSFVGPRPPLRQYVEAFPDLYAKVLRNRPGITGLATLRFHRHEEYLLSASGSPEETEQIYCKRCIPRKARIDLIYQNNRNLCFDIWLMVLTAKKFIPSSRRSKTSRSRK